MNYTKQHLSEAINIINKIDSEKIEDIVKVIKEVKSKKGRIFFLGVGGSAGNCSHAVNDFRKLCNIECYTPTDNVSELTARINDEGWDSCYAEWLKISKLNKNDMILVYSVGGGNIEYNLSINIIEALKLGKSVGSKISGIVGRDGGETAKLSDACIIVPEVDNELTTALTEAYQAVIWHLLVSHPTLYASSMKWESVKQKGTS